jgi:hypothetical protein
MIQKFVPKLELLLLGAWLGSACYFSFGVAPGAFDVLPTREAAGALVARSLMIINFAGLAVSIVVLLLSLVPTNESKKLWLWTQRILVIIMGAACATGQFVIAFSMAYLKVQMKGPIDDLAANDPLRVQFNNLHQYSVWVLVTAMVASLLAFFVISRKRGDSSKKSGGTGGFEMPDELKF